WSWNAASVVVDKYTTYTVDVRYEARNAGGALVHEATGQIALGYLSPGQSRPPYTLQGPPPGPAKVVFNPPQASANKIRLSYRLAGTTGAYTYAEITKANGIFAWDVDAAGVRPGSGQPDKVLEYFYDVVDAAGVLLPSQTGEDHARGVLTINADQYQNTTNQ